MNIKAVVVTCFGTSLPSSRSIKCRD